MIYVVVLNWNGWRDTIGCLQSVFQSKGVNFKVVVCDNGSTDDSVVKITDWAKGKITPDQPPSARLQRLIEGVAKVDLTVLSKGMIERKASVGQPIQTETQLTLIENQANLGFAGGLNSGIAFSASQHDFSALWLLNNDTLVEPDALLRMKRRQEKFTAPAICGSRVMFYDNPEIVQTLGGNSFNKFTGNAGASIGRFTLESDQRDPDWIEREMDYVSGCSMLVPKEFIEEVGLMEDSYFLYYEEIDWFVRGRGKFATLYADDAVIYHKEGGSIGSASLDRPASIFSEFYQYTSKLKFMRKHFRYYLPICYLVTFLQVLNRWRRGRWKSGSQILQILTGLKTRPCPTN